MDKSENKKRAFNYNYPSVILMYAWALLFIVEARKIDDPSSRIFPYFVGGLAIVLATIMLIKSTFNLGKQDEFDFSGTKKSIMFGVILSAYVTFIWLAGFYIATPIYLAVGMWLLGQRNKKTIILLSIIVPVIVYLFFGLFLKIRVPLGILFG